MGVGLMVLVQLQDAVPENSLRFEGHETHAHDAPHLIHAFSGRIMVEIEGERYVLAEGESIWLFTGVPHAVKVLAGGLALGPMLYPWAEPPRRVTFLGKNQLVRDILRQSVFSAARTAEEVEPFRVALCKALENLSAPYFHAPWPQSRLAKNVAEQAVTSKQTLSELATCNYTSVRQIQRIFREETGITFSQWRRRARLNRAYDTAVRGGRMDEVLYESGYASRAGLAKAWEQESSDSFGVLLEQMRT